jgi:hypothetical protein
VQREVTEAAPPRRAALLAPLVAALLVRLACLALLGGSLPQLGDANGYLYLAREFRWKGNLSWMNGGVRPPLHRMLLAYARRCTACCWHPAWTTIPSPTNWAVRRRTPIRACT